LIVFMLVVLLTIQVLIGERRLGRRAEVQPTPDLVAVQG
jgi:hypothetical protein